MDKLKGIISVLLGAASYGLLATVVKFGNLRGLEASGMVFFQYFFGFIGLLLLSFFDKRKMDIKKPGRRQKLNLIYFGTSLGLTSCFYYLSIQYVPVSIAIILLMQSIWMGGVFEMFLDKVKPSRLKVIGSIVVLIGTVLAVNIFGNLPDLSFRGLGFGLLASISFTVSLSATNRVEIGLPVITRSKYLVLGGLLAVLVFWNLEIFRSLNLGSVNLYYFGLFLAFFGCIVPPILFNRGFPIIGIGLGSILASMEIPVSIFSAMVLLDEKVEAIQWMGVCIILVAVVIVNLKYLGQKEIG